MVKLQGQEWKATLRTHLDLVCVRVQEVSKCFDFNFKKLLVLACLCFETFFGCVWSKASVSSHYWSNCTNLKSVKSCGEKMKIFFFLFLSVLLKVGRLLERIEGKLLKTFGDKFLVMNFLLCEPSTKISTFLPPFHTHITTSHVIFQQKQGRTYI